MFFYELGDGIVENGIDATATVTESQQLGGHALQVVGRQRDALLGDIDEGFLDFGHRNVLDITRLRPTPALPVREGEGGG